jgi:transcriptional regulator with XRE-family HTH domain
VAGPDFARLGRYIARRRMDLNLSPLALADRAGVSPGTIAHAENGRPWKRRPLSLDRIESALGWMVGSVNDILYRHGEPRLRDETPSPERTTAPQPSARSETDERLIRLWERLPQHKKELWLPALESLLDEDASEEGEGSLTNRHDR